MSPVKTLKREKFFFSSSVMTLIVLVRVVVEAKAVPGTLSTRRKYTQYELAANSAYQVCTNSHLKETCTVR